MESYRIGTLIKEFRIRKNISQEELSFDLCATSTLSKIESEEQLPNRKLVEAIFSKLGFALPAFSEEISGTERKKLRIERKIKEMVENNDYSYGMFLTAYQKLGEATEFEKQFLIFYESLKNKHSGYPLNAILQSEIEALHLTAKSLDLENLPEEIRLTSIEEDIIEEIGENFRKVGRKEYSKRILLFLFEHFLKNKENEVFNAACFASCLMNLAILEAADENFCEVLKFSEEGTKLCKKHSSIVHFADFLVFNSISLFKLGNETEGIVKLRQALSLLSYTDKEKIPGTILKLKRKFGINLSPDDFVLL
ncbi:MAG: helix-turn-helix transcriptional regulator [Treponema sp.]|nr:helix-turn-helix transcriptional regulator [Treponema sp.]MBR4629609.1 helix-turn-helix transcriptional regulator [Treponema sp.]